jgi:hypothetical protein
MDDFEVEVSPIERDEVTEPDEPATFTPQPAVRSSGRNRRRLRVGALLVTLLLVGMGLAMASPEARSALVGLVVAPTTTATPSLAGGQDRIAVENQLPWGTLLVDGRPGPALAPLQPGTATSPPRLPTLGLSRGRHILEYRADPFPVLRCTLSVPAAPGDTCPTRWGNGYVGPIVIDGPATRLLDLEGTVDRLPASEQVGLVSATRDALTAAAVGATDTLAPGDHYLDAADRTATAGKELTAVPTYTLVPDTLTVSQSTCVVVCSDDSPWAQTSADDWLLWSEVELTWTYRDAAGRAILTAGPSAPPQLPHDGLLQVGVRRVAGAWQVIVAPAPSGVPLAGDPLSCFVGGDDLGYVLSSPGEASTADRWPVAASLPTSGCVLGGGAVDAQGNLTGPVALVLYRSGALLTVNDKAHADLPSLPRADPRETALALAAWASTAESRGSGTNLGSS